MEAIIQYLTTVPIPEKATKNPQWPLIVSEAVTRVSPADVSIFTKTVHQVVLYRQPTLKQAKAIACDVRATFVPSEDLMRILAPKVEPQTAGKWLLLNPPEDIVGSLSRRCHYEDLEFRFSRCIELPDSQAWPLTLPIELRLPSTIRADIKNGTLKEELNLLSQFRWVNNSNTSRGTEASGRKRKFEEKEEKEGKEENTPEMWKALSKEDKLKNIHVYRHLRNQELWTGDVEIDVAILKSVSPVFHVNSAVSRVYELERDYGILELLRVYMTRPREFMTKLYWITPDLDLAEHNLVHAFADVALQSSENADTRFARYLLSIEKEKPPVPENSHVSVYCAVIAKRYDELRELVEKGVLTHEVCPLARLDKSELKHVAYPTVVGVDIYVEMDKDLWDSDLEMPSIATNPYWYIVAGSSNKLTIEEYAKHITVTDSAKLKYLRRKQGWSIRKTVFNTKLKKSITIDSVRPILSVVAQTLTVCDAADFSSSHVGMMMEYSDEFCRQLVVPPTQESERTLHRWCIAELQMSRPRLFRLLERPVRFGFTYDEDANIKYAVATIQATMADKLKSAILDRDVLSIIAGFYYLPDIPVIFNETSFRQTMKHLEENKTLAVESVVDRCEPSMTWVPLLNSHPVLLKACLFNAFSNTKWKEFIPRLLMMYILQTDQTPKSFVQGVDLQAYQFKDCKAVIDLEEIPLVENPDVWISAILDMGLTFAGKNSDIPERLVAYAEPVIAEIAIEYWKKNKRLEFELKMVICRPFMRLATAEYILKSLDSVRPGSKWRRPYDTVVLSRMWEHDERRKGNEYSDTNVNFTGLYPKFFNAHFEKDRTLNRRLVACLNIGKLSNRKIRDWLVENGTTPSELLEAMVCSVEAPDLSYIRGDASLHEDFIAFAPHVAGTEARERVDLIFAMNGLAPVFNIVDSQELQFRVFMWRAKWTLRHEIERFAIGGQVAPLPAFVSEVQSKWSSRTGQPDVVKLAAEYADFVTLRNEFDFKTMFEMNPVERMSRWKIGDAWTDIDRRLVLQWHRELKERRRLAREKFEITGQMPAFVVTEDEVESRAQRSEHVFLVKLALSEERAFRNDLYVREAIARHAEKENMWFDTATEFCRPEKWNDFEEFVKHYTKDELNKNLLLFLQYEDFPDILVQRLDERLDVWLDIVADAKEKVAEEERQSIINAEAAGNVAAIAEVAEAAEAAEAAEGGVGGAGWPGGEVGGNALVPEGMDIPDPEVPGNVIVPQDIPDQQMVDPANVPLPNEDEEAAQAYRLRLARIARIEARREARREAQPPALVEERMEARERERANQPERDVAVRNLGAMFDEADEKGPARVEFPAGGTPGLPALPLEEILPEEQPRELREEDLLRGFGSYIDEYSAGYARRRDENRDLGTEASGMVLLFFLINQTPNVRSPTRPPIGVSESPNGMGLASVTKLPHRQTQNELTLAFVCGRSRRSGFARGSGEAHDDHKIYLPAKIPISRTSQGHSLRGSSHRSSRPKHDARTGLESRRADGKRLALAESSRGCRATTESQMQWRSYRLPFWQVC
jgi:hypothetical protein